MLPLPTKPLDKQYRIWARYVFDQTLTHQHLSAAQIAITDLLGDGAALIYQRPARPVRRGQPNAAASTER